MGERRAARFGLVCSLALAACGSPSITPTVATVEPVRGATTVADAEVGEVARLTASDAVSVAERALARLRLDGGARLLLDGGAQCTATGPSALSARAGRLFVQLREGESLVLETPRGTLRASGDAAYSVAVGAEVELYVVRGEVGVAHGETQTIAAAGERLTLGEAARLEDAALFTDWTGGLAVAGLEDTAGPVAVGTLEGRVPEEVGRARWPLVMRRLDVRVRIEGEMAITEVDQVFFNPASEALEGFYRIRVPEGAVLSRFAVDRNGRLVDGYVRERVLAQRSYQQQVYVGSTLDPALLEWDGPGRYRARIYPIPAGATRRIVTRYAEWLPPGPTRRYRYPMASQVRVQELSIDVDVSAVSYERVRAGLEASLEEGAVRVRRSDFVPHGDFWVELIGTPDEGTTAWRAAHEPPARAPGSRAVPDESDERDYFYLPLTVPADLGSASEAVDLVVLADLSAGTDRAHLELGRAAIESLVGLLGEGDRVAIVGGDLGMRALGEDAALGPVEPARVDALLEAVSRAPAAGATDLGGMLTEAAALLDPERPGAVVYVGDGTATVGEREVAPLRARLARLPSPTRFYALALGGEADFALLGAATAGGGLTLPLEENGDAADAALRLLAHAARPVAHDVTVELGDGVESAFPREAVDVVLGDVLSVAGRLSGDPPSAITLRGTLDGAEFERRIEVRSGDAPAATDLRLRWAQARLLELLETGASDEEVAELGVRYGLITPFTSYYVPSAAELGRMGAHALLWIDRPDLHARRARAEEAPAWMALALGPLALVGCADRSAPLPPGVDVDPNDMSEASGDSTTRSAPPVSATPAAQPAPPAPPPDALLEMPAEETDPGSGAAAPSRSLAGERMPRPRARRRGARGGFEACQASAPNASGSVTVELVIGPDGGVMSARVSSSSVPASIAGCVLSMARSMSYPATGAVYTTTQSASFSGGGGGGRRLMALAQQAPTLLEMLAQHAGEGAHQARRCSDAASLPVSERVALWRERLAAGQHFSAVRAEAARDCELSSWRARRAFIDVVLGVAGGVHAMIQIAQSLGSSAERAHARAVILRRARTSEDVRAIRAAFGDDVGYTIGRRIIDDADPGEPRLRVLRRMVMQYPRSFELKLRLMEELEAASRFPEASRVAEGLRADPLSDAGIRTAIGEMQLRRGEREAARRTFSEIVEFAPLDELARRRLGDIYRAHGWFQEAYRQYETLRDIRPDDPGVLLLLAQAAAGAGRVDEALRLERSVAETAQPGNVVGLARVALLRSSVRFVELEHGAAGDRDRLRELALRRHRSGVLGIAQPLRATLTFEHPDAHLSLWAGYPGLSVTRPTDIHPEYGVEAFELEEQEAAPYRLEVRRDPQNAVATVEGQLTIVWNEGEDDELVEIVPLRFAPGQVRRAWTVQGRVLTEAPGAPER